MCRCRDPQSVQGIDWNEVKWLETVDGHFRVCCWEGECEEYSNISCIILNELLGSAKEFAVISARTRDAIFVMSWFLVGFSCL